MKNLNLSFIVGVLLTLFSFSAHAQVCEIDTSLGEVAGFFPDTLADGIVGQEYNSVIQFILPQDTVFTLGGIPLSLSFCSFRLQETVPPLDSLGLRLECEDSCVFIIDHTEGVINRECLLVTGVPTRTLDSISVKVVPTLGSLQGEACVPTTITLPPALLDQFAATFKMEITTSTSIADFADEAFEVSLQPNPGNQFSELRMDLPENSLIAISLIDLMGKKVMNFHEGRAPVGENRFDLNYAGVAAGLYFVRVDFNNGDKVLTKKLLIQR